MKPRVIYVDVDHTLIRYAEDKRMPVPEVIERVRRLHSQGEKLYLWSSAGEGYARSTAEELGIEGCFMAFLPKPETYIDDLPVNEWINCEHSLPTSADAY